MPSILSVGFAQCEKAMKIKKNGTMVIKRSDNAHQRKTESL